MVNPNQGTQRGTKSFPEVVKERKDMLPLHQTNQRAE